MDMDDAAPQPRDAPNGPRLNSAAIRRLNTARIFHALRERPSSSQRALAGLTGLDAATVSAIVARLESDGVVARSAPLRSGHAGRPESRLGIDPAAGLLVGAAIEPDMISLVAMGLDGGRRARLDLPGSTDPRVALARLRRGVAEIADGAAGAGPLVGLGIGVPGLLDAAGHLVLAPNLGWRDVALVALLRAAFAVPVRVDNDAKAAALAERVFGVARGMRDFVFIYGNAGIGGGLHLGGRLYRGGDGLAGELGHMKVVPGGRPCSCGGRGCLEAYVSERAIEARLREAGRDLAGAEAIAAAAAGGDSVTRAVLEDAGGHLGLAIANIVNALNPRAVVLGGNLAVLAAPLLGAARRALAANGLPVTLDPARVLVSPFGTDAVPMGGAALALDAFQPMPRDFSDPG
jgi:predicted NBD/HSP70 family sugar kinase